VFTNTVLNANTSVTIVFTATATQGGLVTNTVTVTSGRPDSDLSDNTAQVTTTVQAIADLALAKAAAGGTAVAGQPFTYTLTITNNGPDTATQVVITDALSSGAVFSAVVTSTNQASLTHSFVGAQATFTVTNIAPSSVFTIVYTVLPAGEWWCLLQHRGHLQQHAHRPELRQRHRRRRAGERLGQCRPGDRQVGQPEPR
jgi:uncharacterized repeat protein (TIGR01451 family)